MTHPEHGRMPCYDKTTLELNKKRGWSVEPKPIETVIIEPEVTDEPKPKRAKK